MLIDQIRYITLIDTIIEFEPITYILFNLFYPQLILIK